MVVNEFTISFCRDEGMSEKLIKFFQKSEGFTLSGTLTNNLPKRKGELQVTPKLIQYFLDTSCFQGCLFLRIKEVMRQYLTNFLMFIRK